VGFPFQDHAGVSFAVKIGTPRSKDKSVDKREWYQKMTLKQWQGISHLIDDPLKKLVHWPHKVSSDSRTEEETLISKGGI
jgi:hypothetical protein